MSLTTFLLLVSAVILITVLVRVFWLELFVLFLIIRALLWVSVASTVSAIAWMILVEGYREGPIDGFGLTWLFFFISYSAVFVVAVFIAMDIYTHFKGFIRDIFKK